MRIKIALTCAFFMPFFSYSYLDMNDLREPFHDVVKTYDCVWDGRNIGRVLSLSACTKQDSAFLSAIGDECGEVIRFFSGGETSTLFDYKKGNFGGPNNSCYISTKLNKIIELTNPEETTSSVCPNSHPFPVVVNSQDKCAKNSEENNNDDSCPDLNGFDVPDLAFSAGDDTTICFPNPSGSGNACSYTSDNGVFQLPPSLASAENVNCETGEPELPYENPNDTDTPDEDGCVIKTGQKYCEAQEEDNCKFVNAAVNYDSVLECNNSCGDINGKFYCPKDTGTDPIPDINDNCTDEVFRLANPTFCSEKSDETDKNEDGKVDNTDVVEGLNTGNQLAESTLSEIKKGNADQVAEQKKLNEKSFANNQLLSSLNSKVSETNGLLEKINDKLNESSDVNSEKGSFDVSTAQSELDELKSKYQTTMSGIKTEASNLVKELNAGGGGFNSCHDLISMNGKTHTRCLDQFSDEMIPISNGILLFFTILAGFVVLGGVSKNV
ncbi:hypothetical protein [Pseudoalteromonas denitrificans]|uniref:Thrombospondin type 3 repeat-containing protein n=1 Tax=Pseudoalteromonas denitrificans DSM 6059 TaxID=1123010 RepID=A0A1I1EZW6_9GAMM|nr:hypothetical protein [Pseudoalteromonas denitrificans]SFB90470.1 hypothetical protein SAMN02745724_00438 [Pseudoalteromonas denitrificans DSM 6059]